AVRITEWSGEGGPEDLTTSFVGYDLDNNYIFEAISADRSSIFGLRSGSPREEIAATNEPVISLNLTNGFFELV
ncbi:MAG TPA: hypothetical protein VE134_04900, partial [Methanomicrobiales archaeon]|nr:hypothetical protein [Methanomicrobiales archaeon]